jgi:hypothetical protein
MYRPGFWTAMCMNVNELGTDEFLVPDRETA